MLAAARLRHVAATHRGLRRYMNMTLIEEMNDERAYAAARLQTEVTAKKESAKESLQYQGANDFRHNPKREKCKRCLTLPVRSNRQV